MKIKQISQIPTAHLEGEPLTLFGKYAIINKLEASMRKGPQKGLFRGRKVSGKHSTIIPAAVPVFRAAKEMGEVTKVINAEIVATGPGVARLKFFPILAGLKVVVRGPADQQILYVYTSDPAKTQEVIQAAWNETQR